MGHEPWSLWIDDLVSGELPAEERAELGRHLLTCEACRAEHQALSSLREATRRLAGTPEPPRRLEQEVRSALLDDDATGPAPEPSRIRTRWLAAASAMLVLGGALFWRLQSPAPPDLPSLALSSYESYRDGALPVAIRTADAAVLGRFFDGLLDFPARVIDLRMMSFTLVGGRVHELGGRASALYVYEGRAGRVLLCQMLAGSLANLPLPDETHVARAFTFHVYRRDPLTAVFWQEGAVLCVLVWEGPPAELLDLAREKAMA